MAHDPVRSRRESTLVLGVGVLRRSAEPTVIGGGGRYVMDGGGADAGGYEQAWNNEKVLECSKEIRLGFLRKVRSPRAKHASPFSCVHMRTLARIKGVCGELQRPSEQHCGEINTELACKARWS